MRGAEILSPEVARGRPRRNGVASLVAVLLLGASWSAGGASAAIKLVQLESQGGAKLAAFKQLKCKAKAGTGPKGFTAEGKNSGWKLSVRIYSQTFDGLHPYDVEYGIEGPADFFVTRGSITFSNVVKPDAGGPPGPELTLGGGISFPNGRKVLAIGFPFVYDSLGPDPLIASFVGKAPCKYGARQ